jgi:large subunit ribosomal protein L10
MNRLEKNSEVETLISKIKGAQIALCVNYLGLSVAQMSNLRSKLREAECEGKVVKNTLAKLAVKSGLSAAEGVEVAKFDGLFKGPTLLISSRVDPVSPAKVVSEFAKTNDKLALKGAFVDGRFVDIAGIQSLALLPGKNQVLAQLLSLLLAPATQVVRLINEPASSLVRVIEAQRKKLSGEV